MYVVRNKKDKTIIHIDPTPLTQKRTGEEVFPDFNSKTMQLLKTNLTQLPDHFNVDKNGNIIEKTFEEKIKEGIIGFDELFHFDGSFENAGFDSVAFVLDNDLIKTIAQCEAVFAYLDAQFEARVAKIYSPGLETKIMKDYIAWMDEGKPDGDKRETKYNTMKANIDAIKEQYKEVRGKLKEIIIPLKEQEA
jgi:hypothetical protein